MNIEYFFIIFLGLKKLEEERDSIKIEEEQKVSDYFKIKAHYSELAAEYSTTIRKPLYCLPFLQSGRLIKVLNKLAFFISNLLILLLFYSSQVMKALI